MPNYTKITLKHREKIKYYVISSSILFFIGFLFYRNVFFSVLLMPLSIYIERYYRQHVSEKRREALLSGFKDVLYTISANVAAGRQIPSALHDSAMQLKKTNPDSDICRELSRINQVYTESHGSIDEMLADFAYRSGIEEIRLFALSYSICRKNGGDIEAVCMKSASLLLDKIAFNSELKAMIAQKKLDIAILVSMPILILLFLNICSFGYISVLYEGLTGRLIMSLCLLLIIGALIWSIKITEINI